MLKKKTEVLQIRLETELLNRYKSFAEAQGFAVSVIIRSYMKNICDSYEKSLLQQQEIEQRIRGGK